MADVTLEAHIIVDASMGVGKPDPVADVAARMMVQESIIDHMQTVLMEHGGPIDEETAQIMARRTYFLIVGWMQAARDFGVIK